MTAGRIADRIGRISVMKIAAVLFFISAIGTGLAPNVWMWCCFRIVGGIGVGVASVIAPAYIAETSPPRIRGRLGSLQQLAIVTGIFLSLADRLRCCAHLAGGAEQGAVAGPGGLAVDVPGDGGSRRRLRRAGLHHSRSRRAISLPATSIPEARKVLTMLLGEKNLEITIDADPGDAGARGQAVVARSAQADRRSLYGIVWVGLGLSVFQQFVGINVIFYYSNVLWEAVGFDESQSFLITVITSIDQHR